MPQCDTTWRVGSNVDALPINPPIIHSQHVGGLYQPAFLQWLEEGLCSLWLDRRWQLKHKESHYIVSIAIVGGIMGEHITAGDGLAHPVYTADQTRVALWHTRTPCNVEQLSVIQLLFYIVNNSVPVTIARHQDILSIGRSRVHQYILIAQAYPMCRVQVHIQGELRQVGLDDDLLPCRAREISQLCLILRRALSTHFKWLTCSRIADSCLAIHMLQTFVELDLNPTRIYT